MADGGAAQGLDAGQAYSLALQTVLGAAEMLRRELGTPDELRQAVTSPGGTTAAGLAVLEEAKFRDLMTQVVVRATERSIELGA